jgi:hypothetical protein
MSRQPIADAISTFDQEIAFLKISRSYPRLEKLGLRCLDLLSALNYRHRRNRPNFRNDVIWHKTR